MKVEDYAVTQKYFVSCELSQELSPMTFESLQIERRDLILQESKCFRHIEIFEPGHLDFVEVNNMGLESWCREQSDDDRVEPDQHCCRNVSILED